jgi:hypothetical protein
VLGEGELVYLHSDHPEDENSFDSPTKVCVGVYMCGWVGMDVCVCVCVCVGEGGGV